VVFDKKDQAGEGEYSTVVRRYGYEPIRFTADGTGTKLNLLDPVILEGTGVQGQARLLNIVTRLARGDQPLDLTTPSTRPLVVHVHQDSPDVGRCETTRTPVYVETTQTSCASATHVTIKPVIDLEQHVHVEAYEAPDRLRDHIELRDLTCVFPHCRRPATRCDLDHITPYDLGGPTSTDNLAPLCRRHHRAKTHSPWTYTMTTPGTYHWTAPSGLTYRRDHHGTTPLDPPPAKPPAEPAEP
jgi:hypothetical protein